MMVSLETNYDLGDTLTFLEDEITSQSPESMKVLPPDEDEFDEYVDEIQQKLLGEDEDLILLFINFNKPLILENLITYNHLLPWKDDELDVECWEEVISRWLHFRLFTHQGRNLLPFDNKLENLIIFLYEVYQREVYDDVSEDDEDTKWYYGEKKHFTDKIELMKEFFYHHPEGKYPPKSWMDGTIIDTISWITSDWMGFRLHSSNTQHLDKCFDLDSHFRDESKG